jgi:hypothetical protein
MKLWTVSVAVAICVTACGSASPLSGVSPTAASSPRLNSPSQTPPSVSSSPVALLPITDPGFHCRLPVDTTVGAILLTGGFVPVPGSFQPDPAASLVTANGQQWAFQTLAQPTLKGTDGLGFDVPLSRWVPAFTDVVSIDGSEYAWTERNSGTPNRLHLTTVADGSDRSFAVGPPQDPDLQGHGGNIPVPLAITNNGVLLTYGWEGTYGIWRLDPSSGSLTKLSGLPAPRGYSAGAIWLAPLRGTYAPGAEQTGDTLTRLDPISGLVQDWFHRDALAVGYLGTDRDGNPWVEVRDYAFTVPEIWRVRGPGAADLILSGQYTTRVFGDAHGTWFANDTGVYLYAGGRIQRVSGASVGQVLGPCV